MPRAKAEKVFSNFSKGLITEASALAFPENAFVSGDNVEIDIKGKISRRLGIDLEPGVVNPEANVFCHRSELDYLNYVNKRDVNLEYGDEQWFAPLGESITDFDFSIYSEPPRDGGTTEDFVVDGTAPTPGVDGLSVIGRAVNLVPGGGITRANVYTSESTAVNLIFRVGSLLSDPVWIYGRCDGNNLGSSTNDVDHVLSIKQDGKIQLTFVSSFDASPAFEVTTLESTNSFSANQKIYVSFVFTPPTVSEKAKVLLMVNGNIEIDESDLVGDYFAVNSIKQNYRNVTSEMIGGQGISGSNSTGISGNFVADDLVINIDTSGDLTADYKGILDPHGTAYSLITAQKEAVGGSDAGYVDFISEINDPFNPKSNSPINHFKWIGGSLIPVTGEIGFEMQATNTGCQDIPARNIVTSYGWFDINTSSRMYLDYITPPIAQHYLSKEHSIWVEIKGLPSSGQMGFLYGEMRSDNPSSQDDVFKVIAIDSDGFIWFIMTGFTDLTFTTFHSTVSFKSKTQYEVGDIIHLSSMGITLSGSKEGFILNINGKTEIYEEIDYVIAGGNFMLSVGAMPALGLQFGGLSVSLGGIQISPVNMAIGDYIQYSTFPVVSLYHDEATPNAMSNSNTDVDDSTPIDVHYHPTYNLHCLGSFFRKYAGFPLTPSGLFGEEKYTFLKWTSVNGVSGDDVLVIAGGNQIVFYDLRAQLLTFEVIGGFTLSGISGATSNNRIALAAGSGRLYVSGDNISPQVVELDIIGKSVKIDLIKIQIRDLEGIDEDIPVDLNPSSLSNDHRYNLLNQGWPLGESVPYYENRKKTKIRFSVPESIYFSKRQNYPSNAESYSFYVDGTGVLDIQTANLTIGTSPAPKGRLILDAFNQKRGANVGLNTSASSKITSRRPTSIAFYAGRVWYSGVTDKDFIGKVYFSQVIKTNSEAGKCHQQNDPTSPELSDLLATDGGVVDIPEAGNVQSMNTLGNGLLLFADNGIWVIRGGEGAFSADNFSVDKIHDASILAPDTLVQAENAVYFLGKSSIYAVQEDSTGLRFVAQSISETTIQTFYNGISENSKREATGAYIQSQQRVVWLYSGDEQYDVRSKYTSGLILDLKLNAFTTFTIGDQELSPKIFGVIEKTTQNVQISQEVVTVGGENVTVGGEDVTIDSSLPISTSTDVKFIASAEDGETDYLVFAAFSNRNFVDWESVDNLGINYSSFFETGFDNLGDLIRNKKAPYLWAFMTRTEDGFSLLDDLGGGAKTVVLDNPSGCLLQYKWNWSDSEASKKWSTQRQIYRLKQFVPADENDPFDYGFEVVETRNKIRGSGKSLKLRFESEDGKDMQIEGWAIEYSAGGRRSKS